MKATRYTWTDQREALREYFKEKEAFIPVIHDIAGPIFLPLLSELNNINSYILLNTIVKPSCFSPIFPMSAMRLKYLGALITMTTPFFIYNYLIRKEGFFHQDAVERDWLKSIFLGMSQNSGKQHLYRTLQAFELNQETDKMIFDGLSQKIPRLTIWGQSDRSLGPQKKYIPKSKRQIAVSLPTAKHFLMMDFSNEITEEITKFIQ